MWKRLLLPRGDTLFAIGLPMGCAAVLLEAYFRSDLGDAETSLACAFEPTTKLIQAHHVRDLEQHGYVVIPNAISLSMLTKTRDDIQAYRNQSELERTANDDDVRQDVVAWIGQGKEDMVGEYPHLEHCVRLIRGIAHALEQHGYQRNSTTSEAATTTSNAIHKVPRQCQLALYQGDENAGYARHLDQCNKSVYELGLLEWMRLSDYRSRAITTILYLNESDRLATQGGALRCWVEEQPPKGGTCAAAFQPPFDILPKGGTLVIFQSDRVEHMVLPSKVDRYALTNWVVDQQ